MIDLPKILIDLIHNESYNKVPDNIFDIDYVFEFTRYGEPFPTYNFLKRYDLLVIAEVIPAKNQEDHLFLEIERKIIKKYLRGGGSLLLASGSGGDFDYKRSSGSIRTFSNYTAVKRYWWGELFIKNKEYYEDYPENLVFKDFRDHEIFNNINKVVLADSTFLEYKDMENSDILLKTYKKTRFRYYEDGYEQILDEQPIIVSHFNQEYNYKVITIGSNLFMTTHPKYGINAFDNSRLFRNIVDWLITK